MRRVELRADSEHGGQRIDLFVSGLLPELTRSAAARLCEGGLVLVDGKTVCKNFKLRGGEMIEARFPPPVSAEPVAQKIPLDIVHEDESLIVINKPQGMVVHPGPGNGDGTLVNALLEHCAGQLSGIGGVERPGIVHRLDKMTSGLLVAAKTEMAHHSLAGQLSTRQVNRIYESVVHGCPKAGQGRVEADIGRHPTERKKMSVNSKNARWAATNYRVLACLGGFGHIELKLETGRTHQIRVHMASIGHPVAGDVLYGPKKGVVSLEGQCLHARTLGFHHPASGEYLEFTSPLPDYFVRFLTKLGMWPKPP